MQGLQQGVMQEQICHPQNSLEREQSVNALLLRLPRGKANHRDAPGDRVPLAHFRGNWDYTQGNLDRNYTIHLRTQWLTYAPNHQRQLIQLQMTICQRNLSLHQIILVTLTCPASTLLLQTFKTTIILISCPPMIKIPIQK